MEIDDSESYRVRSTLESLMAGGKKNMAQLRMLSAKAAAHRARSG